MALSHHDHAGEPPATREGLLDDEQRAEYAEQIGMLFKDRGWPRMEGRVLGYLVMSNAPHVSSTELIEALRASAGSISTATRALSRSGVITRVNVPGDRNHYFRVEDDVYGTFLATEHHYLVLRAKGIEKILTSLGESEAQPRKRLENMHDYLVWLHTYHHSQMLEAWEEQKRQRDANRDS